MAAEVVPVPRASETPATTNSCCVCKAKLRTSDGNGYRYDRGLSNPENGAVCLFLCLFVCLRAPRWQQSRKPRWNARTIGSAVVGGRDVPRVDCSVFELWLFRTPVAIPSIPYGTITTYTNLPRERLNFLCVEHASETNVCSNYCVEVTYCVTVLCTVFQQTHRKLQ